MNPEDALNSARVAAREARAAGAYADDLSGFAIEATEEVTLERLMEWALIEPDPALAHSTRRFGAPITLAKRALLHVLRQYHAELLAQQSRFNIQLTVYVGRLTERVEALERRAAGSDER
jgi:hypothetical protein